MPWLLWCVVVIAATGTIAVLVLSTVTASPAAAFTAPSAVPGAADVSTVRAAVAAGNGSGGGVLGPLNPEDRHGYPLDHYEVTGDSGGALDVDRKVLLLLTSGTFALIRWVIGLAVWLVEWVLDFKMTGYLLEPVVKLSEVIEAHLLGGVGLAGFLLVVAAVMCGVWILRGRTSKGASEIAITLVIAAAATAYITSPARVVFGEDGLLSKTRDLSLEIATLVVSGGTDQTGDTRQITSRIETIFVDTFVRKPHQLINYGIVLDGDPGHRCLSVYNDIVADGPNHDEGEPWERMGDCDEQLGEFNATPTWDRFGAAILTLVAALFVAVLAILIVLTLLVTQLWLVLETIRLLVGLVVGLVPGAGRAQLWRALGGIAAALAAVVATVGFLAVFVVLIRGLLAAAKDQSLFVRFLLLDVALFCGLSWYKKVVAGSRTIAAGISTRLGGRPFDATPPDPRPMLKHSRDELRNLARPAAPIARGLRPTNIRDQVGQLGDVVQRRRIGAATRTAKAVDTLTLGRYRRATQLASGVAKQPLVAAPSPTHPAKSSARPDAKKTTQASAGDSDTRPTRKKSNSTGKTSTSRGPEGRPGTTRPGTAKPGKKRRGGSTGSRTQSTTQQTDADATSTRADRPAKPPTGPGAKSPGRRSQFSASEPSGRSGRGDRHGQPTPPNRNRSSKGKTRYVPRRTPPRRSRRRRSGRGRRRG